MKNAHECFGFAEFEKTLKDTTTRIRLTADCFIGEPADKNVPSQGHLLSVFGTDVEVAAVLGEERIQVGGPACTHTSSGSASAPACIAER
jgi:hypothetical protein